jgi:hypothetical protein
VFIIYFILFSAAFYFISECVHLFYFVVLLKCLLDTYFENFRFEKTKKCLNLNLFTLGSANFIIHYIVTPIKMSVWSSGYFFCSFVWNSFIKFNSVLVQDKLQTLVVRHGRS